MLRKWPKNALGSLTEAVNQQIEKERRDATHKQNTSDGGSKNRRKSNNRHTRPLNLGQEFIEQDATSWVETVAGYPTFNEDVSFANQGKGPEVTSYYARPPVKRRWCKKTCVGETA
jgi:hypothetical protein